MASPVELIISIRGVLSLLFIGAGITALIIGGKLYSKGTGLMEDGAEVTAKEKKIKLKTVGSVVMATSIAWGYLAFLSLPKYIDNNIEVKSRNIDPSIFDTTRPIIKIRPNKQ